YSGWFDGAYPYAAIKRYLSVSTPGSRLVLGPWNHGGGWYLNPLRKPRKSRFDHNAELLRFFDYHLKSVDTGTMNEKPIHSFRMGEGRWKEAARWPPAAQVSTYYFNADRSLSLDKPDGEGARDTYRVDYTAGSGEHSRWRNQAATDAAVRYMDRNRQDMKLLVYTSRPLDRTLEVTGHPVVTLFVVSSAADGYFF